ncbi:hypothetical protein GCM10023238_27070 [Streptomyces heliomycini]
MQRIAATPAPDATNRSPVRNGSALSPEPADRTFYLAPEPPAYRRGTRMRTALLQSSGRPGSVAENLKVLDEAAGRAAAAGAGLLVTSELFLTGYAIGDDIGRLASPPTATRPTRSRRAPPGTASRSPTATPSGTASASSTPYSWSPPTAPGSRTTARPTSNGCFERDHFAPESGPSCRPSSTASPSA